MKENVVATKSLEFAFQVVTVCKKLVEVKKEYVLSKQFLRSGTAIGALVRESVHAESRADFIHKLSIALKEANETEYWLLLLEKGGYLEKEEMVLLQKKCDELIRLLASSVKTAKAGTKK